MLYRFQKLYIDTIAEDDTVVIVYVSRSFLLGYPFLQAMVEIYDPDGTVESIRGRVVSKYAALDQIVFEGLLKIEIPDGDVTILMKPAHGTWKPCGLSISPSVDWTVNAAAIDISIHIDRKVGERQLQGVGYADLVDLNCFPRQLGIKQLDWGRIHWPGYSLVFDKVKFNNGLQWKRLGIWSGNSFTEITHQFNIKGRGEDMLLTAAGSCFTFKPVRELHAGQALDPSRFPSVIERFLTSAVTGEINERRMLSYVYDGAHTTPGKAIHECVLFGPTPNAEQTHEVRGHLIEKPVYTRKFI